MAVIWELEICAPGRVLLDMSKDAHIVCAHVQGGLPYLCVTMGCGAAWETRAFNIYGTGCSIKGRVGKCVAKFQMPMDGEVYHVFEECAKV